MGPNRTAPLPDRLGQMMAMSAWQASEEDRYEVLNDRYHPGSIRVVGFLKRLDTDVAGDFMLYIHEDSLSDHPLFDDDHDLSDGLEDLPWWQDGPVGWLANPRDPSTCDVEGCDCEEPLVEIDLRSDANTALRDVITSMPDPSLLFHDTHFCPDCLHALAAQFVRRTRSEHA